MTITVRQVLDAKGRNTYCIAPDATVFDALALMAERNIGAVLVTENERLVGIFSERDYARKVVLKGLRSASVSVRDLMSASPETVSLDQSVDEVMNIMTERRFRHLPVLEDGRIAGIITIGDAIKSIIDQQRRTISHLSGYIKGDIAT